LNYFLTCGSYGLIGAALGLGIDKLSVRLQKEYEIGKPAMLLLQLFLMVLVVYAIQEFVSERFASDWQSTTPGLFFVSFFWGIQGNFYANLGSLL